MISAQSPERIKWEAAVIRVIVASGICQSDAQAIVETDKVEVLLNALFDAGTEPALAAQRVID
jgi:hypothetical protein